jgi:hypothetical protein
MLLASAVLLGAVLPADAGEFSFDKKPVSRHVQGGKKKHGQKKGLKKSAKKQAKKGSFKGKKRGKI